MEPCLIVIKQTTYFNFVEQHKEKDFIVHCDAGISRSSAVAFFIKDFVGHSVEHYHVVFPNPWVSKLLRAKLWFPDGKEV